MGMLIYYGKLLKVSLIEFDLSLALRNWCKSLKCAQRYLKPGFLGRKFP